MLTLNTMLGQLKKLSECDASIADSAGSFDAVLVELLGLNFEIESSVDIVEDPGGVPELALEASITFQVFSAPTVSITFKVKETIYTTERELAVEANRMRFAEDLIKRIRRALLNTLKEFFTNQEAN